jgi:hypothetical protein
VRTPGLLADFESPSLCSRSDGAGPAYELKFLLEEERGCEVEAWAQRRLALDPHGDPALGGAYLTTSLYFDTPELDVFHGSPWYRRRKFRVRRYGSMSRAYLECKAKWGDRVHKRRTVIPMEEIEMLAQPTAPLDWAGNWFHHQLLARHLGPACRIAYQRTAYFGSCPEGPLRLTLDRRVLGITTEEWGLNPVESGLSMLTGQVILELKFRSALPGPFKELVHGMRLAPCAVSKYRRCRAACGLPAIGQDGVKD